MTAKKIAQIDRLLAEVRNAAMPATKKVVVLSEILRVSLPVESQLAGKLLEHDGKPSLEFVDDTIQVIRAVLPAYEQTSEALPDLDQRVKAEVEASLRDPARESLLDAKVDDRVWKALNDKFTRSPWFQICIAAAAVAITLFSFGLVNLNKDVKRADEIVSEFQKRLAKADQDFAKVERESSARMNALVDSAVSKIAQMQSDSMKGLSADLQRRITDVDNAKTNAIADIDKAVRRVGDQATLATPELERAKKLAIDGIDAEHQKQLKAYRESASQIIASLREPSIRNVVGQSFWLVVISMSLSVLSIAVAFVRKPTSGRGRLGAGMS